MSAPPGPPVGGRDEPAGVVAPLPVGYPPLELLPDEALERTEMAWVRSGLALAAIGVVVAKRLLPLAGHRVVEGLIIAALGLAVVVTGVAFERRRRRHELASRSALALISAAVVVIGLASMALVLVSG